MPGVSGRLRGPSESGVLGHQHAAKFKGGGLICVFLHRFPCVKLSFSRQQRFGGD